MWCFYIFVFTYVTCVRINDDDVNFHVKYILQFAGDYHGWITLRDTLCRLNCQINIDSLCKIIRMNLLSQFSCISLIAHCHFSFTVNVGDWLVLIKVSSLIFVILWMRLFYYLLHCALSLAVQCIVIGLVCLCVCGSVTRITRNCVHRFSPKLGL